MQNVLRVTLVACFAAASAGAQTPADSLAGAAAKLFSSLSGHWSCDGGFPSGRTLSADMSFAPAAGDRVLSVDHLDRAPGSYWMRASWGLDARSGRVLAMGVAGSVKDHNASPVTWTAKEWGAQSVVFETDSSRSPVNRYAFTLIGDGTLKYGWYLGANGRFVLGDSLVCRH